MEVSQPPSYFIKTSQEKNECNLYVDTKISVIIDSKVLYKALTFMKNLV